MENLGELIKAARKRKSLTTTELAKKIDVTQGYISNLENNRKKQPSHEILKKISTTLEINYFDLMIAAGYFTPEDGTYRKEMYEQSIQNRKELEIFLENSRNEIFQDLANLELGKQLLPNATNVLLDGRILNDDEKQQLLNVARAMFPPTQ